MPASIPHVSPTSQKNSVLVISIPKSGTYLMTEILKNLGYSWTGMHLAEEAYTDYASANLEDARENPALFARSEPLTESLTRIGPGEFAVGHLPFRVPVLKETARFKRIYMTRDLRVALVSYMRFLRVTGRLGARQMPWYAMRDPQEQTVSFLSSTGPYLLREFYACMVGWEKVPGVLSLRFEELTAGGEKSVSTVGAIAHYLGIEGCNAADILRKSLAAETITKSTGTTRLEDYWSEEAERRFARMGGAELNRRFGGVSASQIASQRRVA